MSKHRFNIYPLVITVMISLALGSFFNSCQHSHVDNEQIVRAYFAARHSKNFKDLSDLIADSITIIEGDFIMPYDKASFYEVFRWDSVFQSAYELQKMTFQENSAKASVKIQSLRNQFLIGSTMTCDYNIGFVGGKISEIRSLECQNVDWVKWQKGVQGLVNWTKIHHPELDGFIFDMTMNGAQNYLNPHYALELRNES